MELREKIAEQIESSASMKDVIVQAYENASDDEDEDSDYTYMLKNYFENAKKINDVSDVEDKNKMIVDEFVKMLKIQGTWAINLTIGFYMKLFNVCCIILDERGLPNKINDFNIEKVFGFGLDITKDTKYIFLSYTGRHYKLIQLNKQPPVFTWDTLPPVIQAKFINGPRNNKWTQLFGSAEPAAEPVEPAVEPAAEPAVEPAAEPAAEPPAEPAAEPAAKPADDDDDMPAPPPPVVDFSKQELKEIADLVKQKSLAELKAMVLEKDPNAVLPANKQKLAECVVNPKKCSRKKGKKEKGGTRKL